MLLTCIHRRYSFTHVLLHSFWIKSRPIAKHGLGDIFVKINVNPLNRSALIVLRPTSIELSAKHIELIFFISFFFLSHVLDAVTQVLVIYR
jgi:hypothetical protein